jgi:hypothetical protein
MPVARRDCLGTPSILRRASLLQESPDVAGAEVAGSIHESLSLARTWERQQIEQVNFEVVSNDFQSRHRRESQAALNIRKEALAREVRLIRKFFGRQTPLTTNFTDAAADCSAKRIGPASSRHWP